VKLNDVTSNIKKVNIRNYIRRRKINPQQTCCIINWIIVTPNAGCLNASGSPCAFVRGPDHLLFSSLEIRYPMQHALSPMSGQVSLK
jgi:hypothetical protein